MERIDLRANGLNFAALRCEPAGKSQSKQRALLLHGFPDTPHSFEPVMERLAGAGYSCVAPWMRGYRPTDGAPHGQYSTPELAADAVGLVDALGWEDCLLVGHDWGAVAGYAAVKFVPARFSRYVALSVPPTGVFLRNLLRHPAQLRRSWYIGFFQLPGLPERWVGDDDFALLDRIWRPALDEAGPEVGDAPLEAARRSFRTPGTLEAALAYYRQMLPGRGGWAATRESFGLLDRTVGRPTLMMTGDSDPAIGLETFEGVGSALADEWTLEVLEGGGHFIQVERAREVAEGILEFDGE